MQGGLDVSIKMTETMKNTPEHKQAMIKYNQLINHLYKEPVDRQFEDVTSQLAT